MSMFYPRGEKVAAEQWFPGAQIHGVETIDGGANDAGMGVPAYGVCGSHVLYEGDWLVTLIDGTRFVLTPDVFDATYEPAERATGGDA